MEFLKVDGNYGGKCLIMDQEMNLCLLEYMHKIVMLIVDA